MDKLHPVLGRRMQNQGKSQEEQMSSAMKAPLYPIIYVRGYAGSESAVEETVATPFMGFNLGATKVRQRWDGKVIRHVFESPLVRLMKDYGYRDVYSHGDVIAQDLPLDPRSVIIYRYYDQVSKELDDGVRPDIEGCTPRGSATSSTGSGPKCARTVAATRPISGSTSWRIPWEV